MFKLFRENAEQQAADSIYAAIVAQARRPGFYTDHDVPDTLDGRFDVLVIHAFLFFHRLKGEGDAAQKCGQLVFDAMFADLEQNLREMGVGDMSIGKKVRKMGSAFYGATKAYDDGLARYGTEPDVLIDAIMRNVLADAAAGEGASYLAGYMARCAESLGEQDIDMLLNGSVSFPEATSRA